jgi:hypothetical protein
MSFKELDKYKSLEDLRNFTETLINTTTALQLELQQTKDKLNHLEQITKFNTSPISIGSNEEELCKLEISRLYQAAKTGPLEFNEVKAFEIYVKSLMLIRGKSVNEEKKSKKEPALSNDQLIQLALQVVDDTNEQ